MGVRGRAHVWVGSSTAGSSPARRTDRPDLPSTSRRPRTSAPSSGTASSTARGQERSAPAGPRRRRVDPLPPADDRLRRLPRGDLAVPLDRSRSWSAPEQVLQPRRGAWWDSLRIGIGPPPFRTEHGWLVIYHGVKETVAGGIYRVGLALVDLDEPTRVLGARPDWVFGPLAPYERQGDVPNAVFPCGLVHDANRRDPPLLRRRRHLHLRRHRPTRRPARRPRASCGSRLGVTREPAAAGLRVAVLAPISWRVPPRHYGPWEQFASLLTEGLVDRGVDVTLFATADSQTTAHLVRHGADGLLRGPELDPKVCEALHISAVFERADEFDLIHNSFDFLPADLQRPRRHARRDDDPRVLVGDGSCPSTRSTTAAASYVAISDADRHDATRLLATIHHGIDMRRVRARTGRRATTCCSSDGSIRTRARPRRSTWPRGSGLPLVDRRDRPGRALLRASSSSRASTASTSRTSARSRRPARAAVLGGAEALLHLVDFDEPFGFSVVEAMACGTPVIATAARFDARDRPRRRERLSRRLARRSSRRRERLGHDRQGGRARIGRGSLRRRAHGGRLPRRLPASSRDQCNETRASGKLTHGSGMRPAPHRERLRDRPCDASATARKTGNGANPGWMCRARPKEVPPVSAISLSCRVCATEHPLEATGTCSRCFGPLDPVYDWDALRRTVTRESARRGAAVDLALRRPAARLRTRRASARARLDAPRAGAASGGGDRRGRALAQARHRQPDALLQGPRRRGRRAEGAGARADDAVVLLHGQPGRRRRRPGGRRRAAGGALLPGGPRAGEARRRRGVRADPLRRRRHLRCLLTPLGRALVRARLGLRQRQPALVLRRGLEDARLRSDRAARLAPARRDRDPHRFRGAVPQGRPGSR